MSLPHRRPIARAVVALLSGAALTAAALLGAMLSPLPVAAGPAHPSPDGDHTVIVRQDGEQVILDFDDEGRLTVRDEDGEVTVVDLSQIGDLVASALEQAGDALEELPDIRIDVDEDGAILLHEDGREVRVDVERIVKDVQESLQKAFQQVDRDGERSARDRQGAEARVERKVRQRLEELRQRRLEREEGRVEREARRDEARELRRSARLEGEQAARLREQIDQLQQQMKQLDAEMAALQKEMARLRQRTQH